MRWLLAALGVVLCAQSGMAGFSVQPPPARYTGPYKGHLILHHASPREIMYRRCPDMGAGVGYACTYMEHLPGECTVWMPRIGARFPHVVVTRQLYNEMLKHELAHCNSWPPSHPL